MRLIYKLSRQCGFLYEYIQKDLTIINTVFNSKAIYTTMKSFFID